MEVTEKIIEDMVQAFDDEVREENLDREQIKEDAAPRPVLYVSE
jgi:hypothetical protein